MSDFYKRQKELEKQREEWVSKLKVGDEVAYRVSNYGSSRWFIREVVKITPTGRKNLNDGTVVMPDGLLRGESYMYIEPITEEIKTRIWRANTISMLNRELEISKLSVYHLNQLLNILKEHKEEVNENKNTDS